MLPTTAISGNMIPKRAASSLHSIFHDHKYYFNALLNARRATRPYQQQQCRGLATRQASDDYTTIMAPHDMASLQTKLLQDASSLTRSLYRKCLRSIKLLAGANDRDEEDFAARESKQFDDDQISLMTPPVDRKNELQSRFQYYKTFARENFDGHFNLLGMHGFHIGNDGNMTHGLGHGMGVSGGYRYQGDNLLLVRTTSDMKNNGVQSNGDAVEYYMWREEQIDQFVYLIRSGEEKRQWILNDYGFEDVSNPSIDDTKSSGDDTKSRGWSQELESRLQTFETQSKSLVREMYKQKGWLHSSDYQMQHDDDDDDFFNDSDSDNGR